VGRGVFAFHNKKILRKNGEKKLKLTMVSPNFAVSQKRSNMSNNVESHYEEEWERRLGEDCRRAEKEFLHFSSTDITQVGGSSYS
jgi:hypothetical protein